MTFWTIQSTYECKKCGMVYLAYPSNPVCPKRCN